MYRRQVLLICGGAVAFLLLLGVIVWTAVHLRFEVTADFVRGDWRLTDAIRSGTPVDDIAVLLEADPNLATQPDLLGMPPLHTAADVGRADVVALLLRHGAEVQVNMQVPGELTPIHFAAASGDLDTVRLLLKHGAEPDRATYTGVTPAEGARRRGHAQVAEYLERIIRKER